MNRSSWNQPLDDHQANVFLNELVLPSQAGVFNTCCKVYAPKYRQATIASYFYPHSDGKKALELAYQDVKTAFEYFIEHHNQDRPFILAGHSQGADHANRILQEVLTDEMLSTKLVAAYTIGRPIAASDRLPVCSTPNQTGCQIGWNSQTKDAETVIGQPDSICVNPLAWTSDNTLAPASLNKGSVDFSAGAEIEKNVADAKCENGVLLLTDVQSDNFRRMPFGGLFITGGLSTIHLSRSCGGISIVIWRRGTPLGL